MIRFAIAGATGRMGRTVLERAGEDGRFEIAAAITISGDPVLGQRVRVGAKEVAIADRLTDPCDVLIDFTLPAGTMHWLDVCEKNKTPMVIGATGHDASQLDRIRAAAHAIPIVKATNFSLGVNALLAVTRQLAGTLGPDYDIEIVETHHRRKVDAPSGTAVSFLEAVRSARAGDRVGLEDEKNTHASTSRGGDPPFAKGGLGGGGFRGGGALHGGDASGVGDGSGGDMHNSDIVHGRHGETGPRKKGEIGVHAIRMGDVVGHHEIHFGGPGETVTLSHTALSRTTFAAGALHAAAWVVGRPAGLYSMSEVLGITNY